MKNCIFCQKIRGEVEAKKVYEDESVLAFIPRDQINKGHLLITPKEHFENIFDIPTELLNRCINLAKDLASQLKDSGATGVNILHASGQDAQQSVPHFHLHVVPRYPDDGLDLWFKAGIEK